MISPPETMATRFATNVMKQNRQHSRYTGRSIVLHNGTGHPRLIFLLPQGGSTLPSSTLQGTRHTSIHSAGRQWPGVSFYCSGEVLTEPGYINTAGDIKNVKKNPVAEKAILELQHELRRQSPGELTYQTARSLSIRTMA